jgi:hypothetical protein
MVTRTMRRAHRYELTYVQWREGRHGECVTLCQRDRSSRTFVNVNGLTFFAMRTRGLRATDVDRLD